MHRGTVQNYHVRHDLNICRLHQCLIEILSLCVYKVLHGYSLTYVRVAFCGTLTQVEFYVSQNFPKCLCDSCNYVRCIWLKLASIGWLTRLAYGLRKSMNFCCPSWILSLFPARCKIHFHIIVLGTVVAQWLRCCATNRKVSSSIPAGVIGIFHWRNPSDRTVALGSTRPLAEMSTKCFSWG